MQSNSTKQQFMAKIMLARGSKHHAGGDFTKAEACYLAAIQGGAPPTQEGAIAALSQLRYDAEPQSIVYMAGPGLFLEDQLPNDARTENVYAYARYRSQELGRIVILETRGSAFYLTPNGNNFWGPKIPKTICERVEREPPCDYPNDHDLFI